MKEIKKYICIVGNAYRMKIKLFSFNVTIYYFYELKMSYISIDVFDTTIF